MGLPSPVDLLALSFVAYVAGTAVGLAAPSRSIRASVGALALAFVGCALTLASAIGFLLGGSTASITLHVPGTVPAASLLLLEVSVDPLASLFLLLVGFVGLAVTLASIGYVPRYVHERPSTLAGLFSIFLASMVLVVSAGTTFLFLVAWEAMTLISYLLVVHEHGSWEVRRAGLTYLVMSHAAAAALLAGFVLLGSETGTTVFASMAASAPGLSVWVKTAVFASVLVGFGTKAGMVPLHTWLPEAHPSAPSNVSSLMSGVMIKVGIYGLLRVALQVLGGGPIWWGLTLLLLGAISALVGVLNAIAQHDVKRLLAFHSVENIGIIFMALGAALVFLALGYPTLAGLALLAGVLHTFNHALFKALLFLGAGAVVGETGTRDMERMGGLARAMPRTALTFLVGAMAISALPPLNGFVSEWLLFQAFFGAFSTGSLGTEVAFTSAAAVLALASGLAAYCFVKAFGITFLARPRSAAAAAVRHEAPLPLQASMALLAAACVVVGVLPALVMGAFAPAVDALTGSTLAVSPFAWVTSLPLPTPSAGGTGSTGSLAMGTVALVLAAMVLLAWGVRRVRAVPDRRGAMWDCGLDAPTARMEYTASGYAQPVLRIFAGFYGAEAQTETGNLGGARPGILQKVVRSESEVGYPLVERVYAPFTQGLSSLARRVSRLQSGGIHAYLGYMVLTLVVLLLAARYFGGMAP